MNRNYFLFSAFLLLQGCVVAGEKPGFDTRIIVPDESVGASGAVTSTSPPSLHTTNPCPDLNIDNSSEQSTNHRDECIYRIKSSIEDSYVVYRMKVARLVGYTGEALDITAAGSNAISTATNKVASKVFSAIAGTATGSRGAFNSDALYQASLQAIFKQMDADRTNVWSQIMISTQDKLPKYPMYQAQDDLYTYYKAGTIQSAMDSLDASTGAAATTCKAAAAAVSNAVKVVKVSGGAGSGGPTVDQPNGATQATSSGGADPGSSAKDAGAATPTNTGQCSQMLQSANQALVMIGVQAKATVSKKAALSKFIKEQLSENKSYLDKVANILSVDISTFPDQSSYNKERGKVLIALSAESDQSTINDVANELQSLTGKDPSK